MCSNNYYVDIWYKHIFFYTWSWNLSLFPFLFDWSYLDVFFLQSILWNNKTYIILCRFNVWEIILIKIFYFFSKSVVFKLSYGLQILFYKENLTLKANIYNEVKLFWLKLEQQAWLLTRIVPYHTSLLTHNFLSPSGNSLGLLENSSVCHFPKILDHNHIPWMSFECSS